MTLEEAITALQVHARQHEAIQTIAGAIKDVASIKQLTDEAEQVRAQRQADADVALARLNDLKAQAADAGKDVQVARSKAIEIVNAANERARSIKSAADVEASKIIAAAQKNALSAASDANAQLDALNRQVASTQANLTQLTDSHAAKTAELAELEDKIAKARAIVSGLLK